MGWGIIVNGLYLSRVTPDQVKDRLEQNEKYLQMVRDELIAMASYTGVTYFDGTSHIAITDHATTRVPELLEWLEELHAENLLLRHIIENPKEITFDG